MELLRDYNGETPWKVATCKTKANGRLILKGILGKQVFTI
jgi:hypothetical protein